MSRLRFILSMVCGLVPLGLAQAQIPEDVAVHGFLQQSKGSNEDRAYQRGKAAIDARRWDQALEAFNEASGDGALYWKAYALNKLGRRDEALASLGELLKSYPSSRWLDDAKALDIEVRQASGQKVNPNSEPDEELKLLALNGLMNSDPDRALPILEKLLQGNQSPRLKERALFVLSQSDNAKARQVLARVARGSSNPDLQMKAINYLGVMGSKENRELLSELYGSADPNVKRAVLHAFMISGDHKHLLQAAQSEKNPDLRTEAIHQLGISGGQAELWQLYQAEPSIDVKEKILHSMFIGGNSSNLIDVAQHEKEVRLRKAAIHSLGLMGGEHTGAALVSMYSSEPDASLRGEIVNALFIQGNAKAMVDLARKESNPEMRKAIVSKLAIMGNKDATEYLMELLNK